MTIRELGAGEAALAYAAMHALRTNLDAAAFTAAVERQRAAGYRLAAAFEDSRDEAVAVAGFRVGEMLAWGRYLYVDDLSTLPDARRSGHAGALLDWLLVEAARLGCDQFHLDSGVESDRLDAHRLYLNAGLRITAFHFARQL